MKKNIREKRILHIDGDAFFASCEASLNHKLKNKPMVTGRERGMATAISQEAKKLGVSRGMPIFLIKKQFPEVLVVDSNYRSYSEFASRMFEIVRRFTPLVEEYSIDECFADLTNVLNPEKMAQEIKQTLKRELGLTFSIGLASTKVIAKIASKWNKPDGFTVIRHSDIRTFLKDLQIGKVWGIGPATSMHLRKHGIQTALNLIDRPKQWVEANLSKPELERWKELQGEQVYKVHAELGEKQVSIQRTRSLSKTANKEIIFSELSNNIENACANARADKLKSRKIYIFLKTQTFRYKRAEVRLTSPTNSPTTVLNAIRASFDSIYDLGVEYRATGVTLSELSSTESTQNDLFGEVLKNQKKDILFETIDKLERRYGKNTIQLGSSLKSSRMRKTKPNKPLWILSLGEVV